MWLLVYLEVKQCSWLLRFDTLDDPKMESDVSAIQSLDDGIIEMEYSKVTNLITVALFLVAGVKWFQRLRTPLEMRRGFRLTPLIFFVLACGVFVGAPLAREAFGEWLHGS